jgi:hypothetical protein
MTSAGDVETRGAIEASEGAGGRSACDGSAMGEGGMRRGGLEKVERHRSGSGVRSYKAWTLVQEQRLREAESEGRVSDDRRGDGLV